MFEQMGVATGYDLQMVIETAVEMGREIDAELVSSMTRLCAQK